MPPCQKMGMLAHACLGASLASAPLHADALLGLLDQVQRDQSLGRGARTQRCVSEPRAPGGWAQQERGLALRVAAPRPRAVARDVQSWRAGRWT